MKAIGKPSDIFEKLSEMAGFPENEEISLYEVSTKTAGWIEQKNSPIFFLICNDVIF